MFKCLYRICMGLLPILLFLSADQGPVAETLDPSNVLSKAWLSKLLSSHRLHSLGKSYESFKLAEVEAAAMIVGTNPGRQI